LPGAFPEGSSMRIVPCEVQITICASMPASLMERWASERERTKGCAATVRATASSRNVRKPPLILRMRHCWDFPAGKAMPPGPRLVKLEALVRPWSTDAGPLCNEAATAARLAKSNWGERTPIGRARPNRGFCERRPGGLKSARVCCGGLPAMADDRGSVSAAEHERLEGKH
jgi:hypothetical protein